MARSARGATPCFTATHNGRRQDSRRLSLPGTARPFRANKTFAKQRSHRCCALVLDVFQTLRRLLRARIGLDVSVRPFPDARAGQQYNGCTVRSRTKRIRGNGCTVRSRTKRIRGNGCTVRPRTKRVCSNRQDARWAIADALRNHRHRGLAQVMSTSEARRPSALLPHARDQRWRGDGEGVPRWSHVEGVGVLRPDVNGGVRLGDLASDDLDPREV